MFSALVIGVMYVAIFQLLDHQSWYTGGNGDDAQVMPCPVIHTMRCIQACQVMLSCVMLESAVKCGMVLRPGALHSVLGL